MLPLPGSSRGVSGKPRIFFPPSATTSSPSPLYQIITSLRTRTRLTNLGVTLLAFALTISLLLNLIYISPFSSSASSRYSGGNGFSSWRTKVSGGWDDAATLQQHNSGIPLSIETTIERDPRYSDLDHLIMVPGHAIWIGHDIARIEEDEEWVLQPMQKGGSVRTFIKHVVEGVKALREDSRALLVFSGGATRAPPSPPLSEAYSYRSLAMALDLLPPTPLPPNSTGHQPLPLHLRTAAEEFALDSYENLLFSLARFKEVTGHYPSRTTVVGYGMKKRRFTDLHRAAMNFPLTGWNYIGIDDEGDTTDQYSGELKYGYTPFLSTPSGCHPPLSIKRVNRNPFFRYHPYHTSCPEMVELLEWCPPIRGDVTSAEQMQVFEGHVPWREEEKGWGREIW